MVRGGGGRGGERERGGSGKIRGRFRRRGRRMSRGGFMREGRGGRGGFRGVSREGGDREGLGSEDRRGHGSFIPRGRGSGNRGGRGSFIPRGHGRDNRGSHGSFIPGGRRGMGGGPGGIGGGLPRQPTDDQPKHSRFDRGGVYETDDCNASGYTSAVSTESQSPAIRLDTMWKFRLVEDMKDPEKRLFIDDQIVILNDAYPKAEKHFLVLPRKNISSLANIKMDDIGLLKHMDRKGREIAVEYGEGRNFKLGYHAQPHMERLHLHVISDDLTSRTLKHLRHWNLFTTPLFMDSKRVIEDLGTFGKIQFPSKEDIESFMNAPLKCHKCNYVPKHMPALKEHLLRHR